MSLVAMAAAFALWVASCASLYAQLPEHDALGGVLEAFPDQPPTLQANVIVSAVLGVLLLLKVRKGTRQRENTCSKPLRSVATILFLLVLRRMDMPAAAFMF